MYYPLWQSDPSLLTVLQQLYVLFFLLNEFITHVERNCLHTGVLAILQVPLLL